MTTPGLVTGSYRFGLRKPRRGVPDRPWLAACVGNFGEPEGRVVSYLSITSRGVGGRPRYLRSASTFGLRL